MPIELPPASDAPPRIRWVTLSTARIEEERAWWVGRLGLTRTPGAPDGGFAVAVGDGVLAFAPVADDHPSLAHGGPCHHVALEVAPDRLVEASQWLGAAAPLLAVDGDETIVDFPAWAAHSVYATTPTGHVVELIARHRRPWAPEGEARPSGPQLVRGLSEVGVVAPDTTALVDRLGGLGIPAWFGDPQTGFAAVGDEAGLLICVREWRRWFPTDRPAIPGPVAIALEGVPGLHPEDPVPVGSATELRAMPALG
ncbi:VOC family protein [Patulibacter defluvii]|uniref:VOC family protein n=1 Tax=Patulibacter defluvii TaxID=3095358 RepID=UPI002A74EF5B|nr:VOC family protein [Patulibacter sp. DM4]